MDIAEFKKHHMDNSAAIAVDVFNSEPWNDKWDKESANEMLSRITRSPYFFGLVCIDEKKVIGFILGVFEYWYTGEIFSIREICVRREYQRKGIGSDLLKYLEKYMRQKKVKGIYLTTARNTYLIDFYCKNGFYVNEKICTMGKKL